jgi:hypothetical protein
MDRRLKHLIDEYLGAVRTAVALLTAAGIPRPASDHAWASNGVPGTGALRDGATYRKHGYGCEVHLAFGSVDFDFGRAGQINGFDVWRLADFAGDRLAAFGFNSRDELQQLFNKEVGSGKILSSGYILHYVAEAVEPGT